MKTVRRDSDLFPEVRQDRRAHSRRSLVSVLRILAGSVPLLDVFARGAGREAARSGAEAGRVG